MRSLMTGILQQERNLKKKQYALSFDGVNDYVRIPHIPSYQISNNFTVEMVITANKLSAIARIFHRNGSFTCSYGPIVNPSGLDFYNYSVIPWAGSSVYLNALQKYSISYVKSSLNGLSILVDGALLFQSAARTSNVGVSTQDLFLGIDEDLTTFPYTGIMEEIRYWNTARTAQQIQDNLNKKLTGNEPGLVAYYDFSAGQGSTLFDKSPNANHGTIYGAKWVEI